MSQKSLITAITEMLTASTNRLPSAKKSAKTATKSNSPRSSTIFKSPIQISISRKCRANRCPILRNFSPKFKRTKIKVDSILENYSYTQKIISRELGKDGILRETESETFQLSFYKGNRIRRLIEKNGKPLSENDQKDEDKNVQKRVAEIEKDIAKREAKAAKSPDDAPDEENRRISTAELLRASSLKNPRRERFRGRDVDRFRF